MVAIKIARTVMGGGNVIFVNANGRTVHVRSYASMYAARRAITTGAALRQFCRQDPREAIEWIADAGREFY